MKDRPILFSGAMMKAHLEELKTKTRRLAKPRRRVSLFAKEDDGSPTWTDSFILDPGNASWLADEAPAAAGDLYWAREAWRAPRRWDGTKPRDLKPRSMTICFEAGGHISNTGPPQALRWAPGPENPHSQNWVGKLRPGIHQPRWASRLVLVVTEVRLERLQEIPEADAIAEGIICQNVIIETNCNGGGHNEVTADRYFFDGCPDEGFETGVDAYAALWDQINGPGSWDTNPLVWAISYRPIFGNIDIVKETL